MTLSYERIKEGRDEVLSEVLARLERVQSWGGAYSEIELSPYVEGLLVDREVRAECSCCCVAALS